MLAIPGGILLVIGMKKGWLKNFRASLKDGLRLDGGDSDTINKLNAHSLSEDIADIDSELRYKYRRLVFDIRGYVQRGLLSKNICDMTRAALSWSFYVPLILAVEENHFRKKFIRSRIDEYLATVVKEVEKEYELFSLQNSDGCKKAKLPPFSDIEQWVLKLLRSEWVEKIKELMVYASEEKIEKYGTYLTKFMTTGDKYNLTVCETCIAKNKKYISEIRGW